MASITYHRDKKTGRTYVYRVESYWDKEKKAPRNKQTCLGRLNPETGEIVPSTRKNKINERAVGTSGVSVTSRVAGPSLLLDKLTKSTGIGTILKKWFPEDFNLILSLVYYIVHKGGALSRSQSWSTSNLHPFENVIVSQRISELLLRLIEDKRQNFLSLWLSHVLEDDWLCYDITSVSSYARHNEYTHFGYNRDGESLEQINLAMLFGQKSRLPAHYRRMPGNISDVSTLKTTAKSLDYLGAGKLHFVLDRGFYSTANIDELFHRRHKFTIAVPSGRKWVEKILDSHYENITSPSNYIVTGQDEALYAVSKLYKWGKNKHRSWLHIFYNAERAADEYDRFTRKLIGYKEELLSGKTVQEHEELYKRYLIVKETPKRGRKVEFNNNEIQKHRKKYCGFFCVLSNKIKNANEALSVYRNKDVVENSFDDLKNHLDMKRLRVHSAAAMDGRLFLQFLALVYISSIRTQKQNDDKLKFLTVREIMEEMETLVKVKYSKSYGAVYTETTPVQRRIMKVFDIQIQTQLQILGIEVLRGFALFIMMLNHIVQVYPDPSLAQNIFLKSLQYGIGNVAVIFLFIMGVNMVYSSKASPIHLIIRGIKFLAFAYALNFLRFCLPIIIYTIFGVEINTSGWSVYDILQVIDLFHFAGISFIFFALIKKLNISILLYPLIALISMFIAAMNSGLSIGNSFIDGFVIDIFLGNDPGDYFPFFNWISIPLFGACYGKILIYIKDKDKFYRFIFWATFLILLICFIFLSVYYPKIDFVGWHNPYSYYHMSILNIMFFIIYSCFAISLSYFVLKSEIIPGTILNELFFLSYNVTKIYFISWILTAWGVIITHRGFSLEKNVFQLLCFFFVIPFLTIFPLKVYYYIKKKHLF